MGRRSMPSVSAPRDFTQQHSSSSSYASPTAVFELSPDDCCAHDHDANPFLYSPPKIHSTTTTTAVFHHHPHQHSKPTSPFHSSRPLPRPLLAPSPSCSSSSASSTASSSSSVDSSTSSRASAKSRACSVGSPTSPIHLTAAIKITGFRVDDRNPLDTRPTQSQSQPQRPQFTPSSRRPSFSASDWVINSTSVPTHTTATTMMTTTGMTGVTRKTSGFSGEGENSPPEDGVDFNKCLMQRLARRSRRAPSTSMVHPKPIYV